MKLETIIYILIAVAIGVGCLLLGKLMFETKPDNSRLDSLQVSVKRNEELIREIDKKININEAGVEVHRYYYLQKKEEIKQQNVSKDYKDIINYLDTFNIK